MLQETTFPVDAPPALVWQVLTDVEGWSSWTASVSSVERLDEGPLRVGSRARIAQPRIPTVVWEVGELDEGHSFTWTQGRRAARTTAAHSVDADGRGGSRVHLSVAQEGVVGSVVGRLYKGLTDRYLAMEAAGLTTRCEALARGE